MLIIYCMIYKDILMIYTVIKEHFCQSVLFQIKLFWAGQKLVNNKYCVKVSQSYLTTIILESKNQILMGKIKTITTKNEIIKTY